jgi:hypothetical protein
MEPLWDSLRISIHGNGDHSGDIWAGRKSATHSLSGSARTAGTKQWNSSGPEPIAVEGDSPHRGAHVA